jgi:hypothetical protein
VKLGFLLMIGASMNACAVLPGGGKSWKEEVLLHDGGKVIVKRSQSYGGRHEIGQSPPVKEHTISFTLPNSSKAITWTSEYGEVLGAPTPQTVMATPRFPPCARMAPWKSSPIITAQ